MLDFKARHNWEVTLSQGLPSMRYYLASFIIFSPPTTSAAAATTTTTATF